jgi:hypothetical protein
MSDFFANWSPGQFLALVAIVLGAVCLIAITLTTYGYNLRALADSTALQRERFNADLALKRDLLQRGLSPQELEQTIKLLKLDEPPPLPVSGPSEEDAEVEFCALATHLEQLSPQALEEVIALVRAADAGHKRTALAVLRNLVARGVEGPVALAAIRSVCRPRERLRDEAKPLELSAHVTTR